MIASFEVRAGLVVLISRDRVGGAPGTVVPSSRELREVCTTSEVGTNVDVFGTFSRCSRCLHSQGNHSSLQGSSVVVDIRLLVVSLSVSALVTVLCRLVAVVNSLSSVVELGGGRVG